MNSLIIPFIAAALLASSMQEGDDPNAVPLNAPTQSIDESEIDQAGQILFWMQRKEVVKSIDLYKQYRLQRGSDDFSLVQQMALILLKQGNQSADEEEQLMALFGAGITLDTQLIGIFDNALSSPHPQIQMAAIHFLSQIHDDQTPILIKKALSSAYLPIRFEAAWALATLHHSNAYDQIDALFHKCDPRLHPLFPELLALEGSPHAMNALRRMLSDPEIAVRQQAILSLAGFDRDDLLVELRVLLTQTEPSQQEACAWALGQLQDEGSAAKLQQCTTSSYSHVRLAAHYALYRLGRMESKVEIERMALEDEDLFALATLEMIEGSEETLWKVMTTTENLQARINAALSLLRLRDERCLPMICQIFLWPPEEMALQPIFSPSGAFTAVKAVPSALEQFKRHPYALEIARGLQEQILAMTADLTPEAFIKIAHLLFQKGVRPLVPRLVQLLENIRSDEALDLLKSQAERAGAPLIRSYCRLALYRLCEPGPYSQQLIEWVKAQNKVPLIQFRPVIPRQPRQPRLSSYTLTPVEQSRLFIETLVALASHKEPAAIDALLDVLATGDPKNRYAVAGILLRACE